MARLLVQEAVDGASLEAQVCQGKRDAAEVLGIEQDRIAFVDADPDGVRKPRGPLVRVSGTYIYGGPSEQTGATSPWSSPASGRLRESTATDARRLWNPGRRGAQDSRFWVYVICVTWI